VDPVGGVLIVTLDTRDPGSPPRGPPVSPCTPTHPTHPPHTHLTKELLKTVAWRLDPCLVLVNSLCDISALELRSGFQQLKHWVSMDPLDKCNKIDTRKFTTTHCKPDPVKVHEMKLVSTTSFMDLKEKYGVPEDSMALKREDVCLATSVSNVRREVPIDVIIFTFYSNQLTIDVETGIVTK